MDSTFGIWGIINTRVNNNEQQDVESVAVQADGKIVVAGSCNNGLGGFDQAIVRYKQNGQLDQSFGVEGRVITDVIEGADDFTSNVVINKNGKILVSSSSRVDIANLFFRWSLTCYLSNGVLDSFLQQC